MICLQYLFILFNLTGQPTIGFNEFRFDLAPNILPLASCDPLRVTPEIGQNGLSRSALYPSQSNLATTPKMDETTLEILNPGPKTQTHERLGTLKNALRGPPPSVWNGTRIGSDVYGRHALGSPVAPKKGGFGGIVGNTSKEASFLNNAKATFGDSSVFNKAKRLDGNIIIQRSDIPFSAQNVRRMADGNTPFVKNSFGEWEKINLHHVGRKNGQMIEILSSQNKYSPSTGGPLHIPGPGSPVRNQSFNRNYWTQRLQEAIDSGQVPQSVIDQVGL